MEPRSRISGVILSGGAGRRVGNRDKGLIPLHGKPLVAHVAEGLEPQVGSIIVSCNRNLDEYRAFAPLVVADRRQNFQGPLSGLESVAPHIQTEYIAVVSCDMPYLPPGWVQRIIKAMSQTSDNIKDIGYAHDGDRAQYLCAVIRRKCLSTLNTYLGAGHRSVRDWYGLHNSTPVDFSDHGACFRNYNQLD
jgi:molybdopterin-guanine dinucleotide biosynthesis protein A